jgi:hypothetical protein
MKKYLSYMPQTCVQNTSGRHATLWFGCEPHTHLAGPLLCFAFVVECSHLGHSKSSAHKCHTTQSYPSCLLELVVVFEDLSAMDSVGSLKSTVQPTETPMMACATADNPIALKQAPDSDKRIVQARSSLKNEEFCDNRVITSKFKWWNFLPLFLYAKFR